MPHEGMERAVQTKSYTQEAFSKLPESVRASELGRTLQAILETVEEKGDPLDVL